MIGTNRDLIAMRAVIDHEIFALALRKSAMGRRDSANEIDRRLSALARERVALCAAIVNRRRESAKNIVVLASWLSGYGALDNIALDAGRRRRAVDADQGDAAVP